ncbi:MAG: hypothetical protein AAGA31_17230 [Bacteroidota bacterium]
MPKYTDADLAVIRLLRQQMGEPWETAKAAIIDQLPPGIDSDILGKFVDDSERPSIHINAYGVEPRFYAHRTSRRLLEFYPSK